MQVQGRIDYINTRDTSAGTTYDIKVNGVRYGLFKDKCPYPEGSVVKFEVRERGQYKNVVKGSMELVEEVQKEMTGSGGDNGTSFSDKRQTSIQFQNSRNLAGQVLASLVQADAIVMPKTDKAARYDAMLGLLDDLTWQFFEEVEGLEALREQRAYEQAQLEQEGD